MEINKSYCIYGKHVQYMRKGKWRNCHLKIELLPRCQDKLAAIIKEVNNPNVEFGLYGYECNNGIVSLIRSSDILLIKFESLELVPELMISFDKYMKDVSFKIQLRACNSAQSVLFVNQWYTLHVQTNRICFTTDLGSRLVTKWARSNIGDCYIDDCSLNIEIISNKDKCLYSLFRDERFALEKIFKAIQNLKFESPVSKSEKFPSTPRRSGSVDLRRQQIFGNTRDKLVRGRTYSSSRADDASSIDDSSPPSTPCSPLCLFGTTEPVLSLNNHIDEKDEELDDLMFSIDSTDINPVNIDVPKENGHLVADSPQEFSNGLSHVKLVDLERFPFESDLRNQGKRSPDLNTHSTYIHQTTYSFNPNTNKKLTNSSFYHTMESLQNRRKTSSEANFEQHKLDMDKKVDISHSADLNFKHYNNFKISSSDKVSNSSSPLRLLSSSNLSSDTPESSKGRDTEDSQSNDVDTSNQRISPPRTVFNYEYYNIKHSSEITDNRGFRLQPSSTDDSQYYNLSPLLNQDSSDPKNESTVSYIELDFGDHFNTAIPKKVAPQVNYADIGIYETQILKDLDNTLRINNGKKKKTSFLKSIFKK